MRQIIFVVSFLFVVFPSFGQQTFEDFVDLTNERYKSFVDEHNNRFEQFTKEQNDEFAAFVEEQWQLFENFKKSSSPFTTPKFQKSPVAPKTNLGWSLSFDGVIEFIVKSIPTKNRQSNSVSNMQNVVVDFYGEELSFDISDNLRLKVNSISELSVANYIRRISDYSKETSALWNAMEGKAVEFGLNEWGRFLLTKTIADELFENDDDKVLFCFYMLRNMGGYKVKVGRNTDGDNLVLLLAIDNDKEVYTYGFFDFIEEGKLIKYYSVYGENSDKVYTFGFNNQDLKLSQMGLDFNKPLSIGECDRLRELKINSLNTVIDLPFNSKNIAFLDDVPLTVFPIYFVSAMPMESQVILNEKFGNLKNEYSVLESINILLNFVQTAFDYKTDDEQFGREKYFYPEEVIAYPYSDCEDRSALFGWLVHKYLNLSVIGLQYSGHVATAVCLNDDVNISGAKYFNYRGAKYYVCDPTYVNAKLGKEMSDFENITPKVIKL